MASKCWFVSIKFEVYLWKIKKTSLSAGRISSECSSEIGRCVWCGGNETHALTDGQTCYRELPSELIILNYKKVTEQKRQNKMLFIYNFNFGRYFAVLFLLWLCISSEVVTACDTPFMVAKLGPASCCLQLGCWRNQDDATNRWAGLMALGQEQVF